MKHGWIALLLLFAVGCGSQSAGTQATTSSGQMKKKARTSGDSSLKKVLKDSDPTRYLDITLHAPKKAQKKLNLISIQESLKAFQAINGRWPKSLEELQQNGYAIPKPPAGLKYQYDPKTGVVSVSNATQ